MSATSLRALTTSVMTSNRAGEIPGLSASANHGLIKAGPGGYAEV